MQKAKKSAGDGEEEEAEDAAEQDEDDEKPLLAMVSMTEPAHPCIAILLIPISRLIHTAVLLSHVIPHCLVKCRCML